MFYSVLAEAVLSADVSYQSIDTLVEECYNK